MKKLNSDNKYAIISVLMFLFVFAISLSGTLQGVRLAQEKKQMAAVRLAEAGDNMSRGYESDVRSRLDSYINSLNQNNANVSNTGVSGVWCNRAKSSNELNPAKNCSLDAFLKDFEKTLGACKEEEYESGAASKCIDWCASTYIQSDNQSKKPELKTCNLENADRHKDEIGRRISIFASKLLLAAQKSGGLFDLGASNRQKLEERVYNTLCMAASKSQHSAQEKKLQNFIKSLNIDSSFKNSLFRDIKDISKLKEKWIAEANVGSRASENDKKECKFQGVAYCLKGSSDKEFKCYPKNKNNKESTGNNSSQGGGSTSTGGNVTPGGYTYGQNPYGNNYGIPQNNPYSGQTPNNNNQKYDPCKDPNFSQKSGMNFLEGAIFGISCAFNSKDENSESNKDKSDNNYEDPSCVLAADKSSIKSGETVSLKWRSGKAKSAQLKKENKTLASGISGEYTDRPNESTTYTVYAIGQGGKKATCSKTITVEESPVTLTCNPDIVQKGGSVQLQWACPASHDLKSNNFGADSTEGSLSVTLDESKVFELVCGKEDKELAKTCTVQISDPEMDIIAYPLQLKRGEKARVTWASIDMDSCYVEGPRGFRYDRNYAVVLTIPFPQNDRIYKDTAVYSLHCKDRWGKEYSKDITVRLLGDLDKAPEPEPEIKQPKDIISTTIRTSLDPKECPHFTTYYKQGQSAPEIRKIQIFLKDQGLYSGPIDGYYSSALDEAVRAFQARYADEILRPWGLTAPTGYWYKTTRKKANYLAGCAEGAVVLDDGTVVY